MLEVQSQLMTTPRTKAQKTTTGQNSISTPLISSQEEHHRFSLASRLQAACKPKKNTGTSLCGATGVPPLVFLPTRIRQDLHAAASALAAAPLVRPRKGNRGAVASVAGLEGIGTGWFLGGRERKEAPEHL